MFNEHPKLISTIKKSVKITKKLINIRKSKKNRQHNGKMKRTDNTMAKWKIKNGQTTIYKNTTQKNTLDI